MKTQRLGYRRISSFCQRSDRQLFGVQLDRTFTDKASGKDLNRPELKELITFSRDGDIIIVHSMDRLARNLDDLRKLVSTFTKRNVSIQFIKEGLTFTGEDSPISNLLLSVLGSFSEFERSLIKERQLEGIALAKKRGVYKGRKRSLSQDQISLLKQQVANGKTKTSIANDFGISRETLYSYLRSS